MNIIKPIIGTKKYCILLFYLNLLLFFSSFNFLFSLKVNLGFFITLLSLNDFPLYLFDINFIYFLSALEISAPVVGSSSIPNGVIFLGSGVNVDSGLSL